LADGGSLPDPMRADLDTSERLGVDAGVRCSMPSGWPDTNHAFVPSLLQDSTDGVERLGLFSRGEQELADPLPRFLQGFQDRFFQGRDSRQGKKIYLR